MTNDDFTTRLNIALKKRGMRQIDLTNETKKVMKRHIKNYDGNGIDKTLINKYISGAAKAGNHNLFILAEALNVDEAWLLGYDVPMEKKLVNNKDIMKINSLDTPILFENIKDFDKLPVEKQQQFINDINSYVEFVNQKIEKELNNINNN